MQRLHELAEGTNGLLPAHLPVPAEQLPDVDVGNGDKLRHASLPSRPAPVCKRGGKDVLHPLLVGAPAAFQTRPHDREAPFLGERPKDEVPGLVVIADQRSDGALHVPGLDVVATGLDHLIDPVDRGPVERLLRAEVIDHRLQRDVRRSGHLAKRDLLVPGGKEGVTGRLQNPLSRHLHAGGTSRHSIDSCPTH